MVKVKIDIGKIERAATEAFRDTCLLLHREAIAVISEPGAFEGFDGDIVDTGMLRASQQPPAFTKPGEARLTNTADYSLFVSLGYTLRNGRKIEGRNWMVKAVERVDLQATFNKLLEENL